MSSNPDKAPPSLAECKTYEDWKKVVKIWSKFTKMDLSKQGMAVLLSLKGAAQEAILELDEDQIDCEDGLKNVITRLDKLYLKDETLTKYQALEEFETYKRPQNLPIADYIVQFDKRYHKIKSYGTTISEDLLAFRLLKSANLASADEKLAKGTAAALQYDVMKTQLKKLFSENTSFNSEPAASNIEDINQLSIYNDNDEEEILYSGQRKFYRSSNQSNNRNLTSYSRGSSQPNWRNNQTSNRQLATKQGRNPLNNYGQITRCAVCDSINHWAAKCPDKPSPSQSSVQSTYFHANSNDNLLDQPQQSSNDQFTNDFEVVLYQSDYDHPSQMKGLLAESLNTAVLDSGASKTVCGQNWLNIFTESLTPSERSKIQISPSSNTYKFGDGKKVKSTKQATIPAIIGNKPVKIITDIVDQEIPLLLSRESMKKVNMNINFKEDTANVLGQNIPLTVTQSGHYTMPITKTSKIIQLIQNQPESSITLTLSRKYNKHDIAAKIHKQFAHASYEKLARLLKSAGSPWDNDSELRHKLKEISDNCETCNLYRTTPSRPVVGLPSAVKFQQTVAMDLKFFNGKIILHLIDHATRLSAATVIPNKNPATVVKAILRIWVAVYGTAEKFLTDNGGEFVNAEFLELADSCGIKIVTTAAESPWSNGLVERHNLVISEMLHKLLHEKHCNFELALMWSISAKNSLQNVHGFSPFQLALGQNPKLPTVISDNPQLLSGSECTSNILLENLKALQTAREEFIKAENSSKIRRALNSNIRSYADNVYLSGDSVYYKRQTDRCWRGPALVLGKDGQQVLLKHGGYYIRVHPCRLAHVKGRPIRTTSINQSSMPINTDSSTRTSQSTTTNYASDTESEPENHDEDINHTVPQTTTSIATGHNQLNTVIPTGQQCYEVNESHNTINYEDQANASMEITSLEQSDLNQTSHVQPTTTHKDPSKGDIVRIVLNSNKTMTVKLLSRSGKVGKGNNKWSNSWNVQSTNGDICSIDLLQDVKSWSIINHDVSQEADQEFISDELYQAEIVDDILDAKNKELYSWKDQEVYNEVDDIGQQHVTVRWVITPKIVDGKTITKARLCARGFQEDQEFRTDSPTCSRESVRLALAIIAGSEWDLQSIDIKTAFLQGKNFERTVYLKPPVEANTTKLWHLRKCVYGLADAPREFYLRLAQELTNLGAKPSEYDQGFFIFTTNNKLSGILICHVDDILYGGSKAFTDNVIVPLTKIFKIGTQHLSCFTYIGIQLRQLKNKSIELTQNNFASTIEPIKIDKTRAKNTKLTITDRERKCLRTVIGQLNWLAGISRPDISFDVCQLSTKIKDATISDLQYANKVIRKVQQNPTLILFPKLNLAEPNLILFADASLNNLANCGSQCGHIIFLTDNHNAAVPIQWTSHRIKRVVRSTLAAEALALADGCDNAIYLSKLVSSTIVVTIGPICCITDNRSLHETISSSKPTSEQRLRIDISTLREMVRNKQITLNWVQGDRQLSDIMTKRGASSKPLLAVLQRGQLSTC